MSGNLEHIPAWVPPKARRYLAHTETGVSIRAIARRSGCHASTVMRQIRSFEAQRDDPLVDDALRRLSIHVANAAHTGSPLKETTMSVPQTRIKLPATLSEERLKREGRSALKHLCAPGALLVVAPAMDTAVIVREQEGANPARIATVDKPVAEAMALKGWIQCGAAGRVARYAISRAGREALTHLLRDAEDEGAGTGFAEAPAGFEQAVPQDGSRRRRRYGAGETPLSGLARRKDPDGTPFLSAALVRAGERLREDFELAQMGPRMAQNWDRYLTGGVTGGSGKGPGAAPGGATAARERVTGALRDLGPGLGDVALRCCCYLEGLERIEKRMGWSARSGKIVLRIALQRLKRHYAELGEEGGLIG